MRLLTRLETAEKLGVTPARVSQIAKAMGLHMKMGVGVIGYKKEDVRRMERRQKRTGPPTKDVK